MLRLAVTLEPADVSKLPKHAHNFEKVVSPMFPGR